MFCTRCGNRIPDGDKFCGKCGAPAPSPVVESLPAPAAASSAVPEPSPATPAPTPVQVIAEPPAPSTPAEPFRMFGVDAHNGAESGAGPVAPTSSGVGVSFWLLITVVVLALAASGWFVWLQWGHGSSGVAVQVDPASVHVAPGGKAILSAIVTGDARNEVTWTVMEGGAGGAVSSAGAITIGHRVAAAAQYTAPVQPGTYHVLATSVKDSKQASSAEVVVSP